MFQPQLHQLPLAFDESAEPATVTTTPPAPTMRLDPAVAAAVVADFRRGMRRDEIARQYDIDQEQLAAVLTTGMAADEQTAGRVLRRLDWLGTVPEAASGSQASAEGAT